MKDCLFLRRLRNEVVGEAGGVWCCDAEDEGVDWGMKKNVIIVHGANSCEESAMEGGVENTRHWHPWLREALKEKGIEVSGELYPRDWNPDYGEWKKIFEKNRIDEGTVLIGHSAGCAFILRWLGENKSKVKRVILVAPYVLKTSEYPRLDDLVNFELSEDLEKYYDDLDIFYAENDVDFIVKAVNFIHDKIGGKLIQLEGRGHFTFGDMGTEEFPELVEAVLG